MESLYDTGLDLQRFVLIMREVMAAEMEIHMEDVAIKVPQYRGTKQGSVEGSRVFTQVLASALRTMLVTWKNMGYGFKVSMDMWLALLAFADDIVLIAKSENELKQMLLDIQQALQVVGLVISAEKCKYICNNPAHTANAIKAGQLMVTRLKDGYMPLLGSGVSTHNDSTICLRHRIAMAWRNFWAMQWLFLDQNVCLKVRMEN